MEIANLGAADGSAGGLGRRHREPRCGIGAGSRCAQRSHDMALNRHEDGSPHVTAVGALWMDGTSGSRRAGRGRAATSRDPRCSIAVSIRDADVVIEGDAARVTDPVTVARIGKAWADNGWPAEPDESGSGITAPFNAPSLGPPPWNVYRVDPRSATVALGTEPGGLTRFRF